MPQWLKTMLLARGPDHPGGLPDRPVLAARRRRQQAAAGGRGPPPGSGRGRARSVRSPHSAPPRCARAAQQGKEQLIVLADHDRLVVTCNKHDDTVYVLRPPGEDPRAILRVARLVLPEGPYGELAKQLGMPAVGPVE